jgi:hypothetical protein
MPDWLMEGDRSVLILLLILALIGAVQWWRTRGRVWAGVAVVSLLCAGGFVLLDRFFESDREQIGNSVATMAGAVGPQKLDVAFAHLSADFHYNAAKKADFQRLAESAARSQRVREVIVWNFDVSAFDASKKRADVSFQFKVRGDGPALGEAFYLCKAVYVKEADGRWRMLTFKVYPLSAADQPLVIPGVG